ncbi:MAG: hypothetical protein PUH10_03965 [Erysipelotrichaceae bacterium]|uniref:hypothetical protein n=2 Tax=Floccifex sp. TaxID=2815810 RepID=UPI002A75B571|nr:hypothetical protein [Floccifex sp.]MDD7281133.1 hypothetical protein [Erysipelotrichaceae bacterium]MDY2958067.1 hypothetical protein [Floccifex sp.]
MKEDRLIYTDYPFSSPKMDLNTRAKIFLPFSALKGFEQKIDEANQFHIDKIEIDNDMKQYIYETLSFIESNSTNTEIQVVYYEDYDYKMINGVIRIIDFQDGFIIIDDKKININDIYDIN